MSRADLVSRVAQSIHDEQLLELNDTIVVAISGGADSMALMHLLQEFNERQKWMLKFHIAHLNHQLRGAEADADEEFVKALAKRLRLPFTVDRLDIAKRAESDGLSIEQAARRCRMEFFERVCLANGIKKVVLAHHADDKAETVLHRIIRGTGIRGLAGIRPLRPIREGSDIHLIRPLLKIHRTEIVHYLQENGISYREDASNKSEEFTRNRIRHEVLPLLRKKFNPQVTEALIRLADLSRGLDDYLIETGERMLESLILDQDDRQLVLHCPSLIRKPRVIQTQLIRQAILRLGIGEGELTYGHMNAVADMAARHEGSEAVDLPSGLRVSRLYTRLVFERLVLERVESRAASETRVTVNGNTLLLHSGLELTVDELSADEETINEHLSRAGNRGPGKVFKEEWVNADNVCPPLIARFRRPGDRFFPLGMSGMKKLSDFFIDEKIDPVQRERAIILCDQLGPIWIVPFRIDERVRLTRGTRRVLRLRVRQLETS